jgi:biotin synthase
MIGIGPFIPAQNTKFEKFEHGRLNLTLKIISILRLLFPYALIPSTTALGTIDPNGRELGLKSGANVVMPNLSPAKYRNLYTLYDDKICTNEEAAECRGCLERRVSLAGYKIVTDIGNVKK